MGILLAQIFLRRWAVLMMLPGLLWDGRLQEVKKVAGSCKNKKRCGIFQIADKRSMPSRAVTRNVVDKLKSDSQDNGRRSWAR